MSILANSAKPQMHSMTMFLYIQDMRMVTTVGLRLGKACVVVVGDGV